MQVRTRYRHGHCAAETDTDTYHCCFSLIGTERTRFCIMPGWSFHASGWLIPEDALSHTAWLYPAQVPGFSGIGRRPWQDYG
jgi:hypothetical protein